MFLIIYHTIIIQMQCAIEYIVANIADAVIPALVAATFAAKDTADSARAGNISFHIAVLNLYT